MIAFQLRLIGRVCLNDLVLHFIPLELSKLCWVIIFTRLHLYRYLLLLTKNNIALRIIEDHNLLEDTNYSVIYGSSFPLDQEYTQICYNINRIKIAMETGTYF